jgi:hypothetical protein
MFERTGVVDLTYGFFDIINVDPYEDLPDLSARGDFDGITTKTSAGITINTGCKVGDVNVTVQAHTSPIAFDPDEWEGIDEVSIETTSGQIKIWAPEEGTDDFGNAAVAGPGHYRVRVCARGRDIYPDIAAEETVEYYLIQIWPEPESPSKLVKLTDRRYAYVRDRA